MAEEAQVFRLPLPEASVQTCYACRHAMFGERGTYCAEFSEVIFSEAVAGRDCEAFESSDGKVYVRVEG